MDKHLGAAAASDQGRWRKFLDVFKNRKTGLALVFSGLMMMGHFLIIPFINPYMEFNMGFSKGLTPIVYLVGGVASLTAALSLGRLSDKTGKLIVFSYCVLLSFIFVVLLTNLPPLPFTVVLAFFALWFALATGRAVTSQTMVSGVTTEENRGSFMSLNSSIQHLGTGIAALVAGAIVQKNHTGRLDRYEWVGYLSVLVLLAGFFLGRHLFKGTDGRKRKVNAGS